jgi:carotenoid cleavage dioxygenase
VTKKLDIEKQYCTMVHDFVLTEHYVVIFDCPVILDNNQLIKGGEFIKWKPELGGRIGLISRDGKKVQWLETDPFFVFHFANAYENNNEIIIDYVRYEKCDFIETNHDKSNKDPTLYRAVVNLVTGVGQHYQLDDRVVEFPRIRDDHDTKQHHFIYSPTSTSHMHAKQNFNAMVKYDVNNQRSQVHEFGQFAQVGEAVFAPSDGARAEDDGYLMLYVYDSTTKQSELVILDAKHFSGPPIARIHMPQRVPNGFHGSWIPGGWTF